MPHYRAYGLTLFANAPIPGLVALVQPLSSSPDICVELDAMPSFWHPQLQNSESARAWYVSHRQDAQGQPILQAWQLQQGAYFRLKYCDGTEFIVDRGGCRIWAKWIAPLTLEDTATYLLGPILGFVLRLRGSVCLHASGVAIRDRAVLFLGQAGAGKSTTAAAFAQSGYPVLCDDVAALTLKNGQFFVRPGYPRLRLWSKSVIALFGNPESLPRIVPTHPTWDKRYLDLVQNDYRFQGNSLPLAGIYRLSQRLDRAIAPKIERMSSQAGMMSLIANTYTNYLLTKQMRSTEFEVLGQLLQSVPLQQLHPRADPSYLPQLVELIASDLGTES
ncbi:hypothetical protein IQ249_20190 [Lusitaniella coriacea LEGE 07157]|uniref:HPr kinase n=1 Tax=Lusitaniella coriacea LEGE 07157 TaxID=945747 RepID=A0A8J7E0Y0_9CYAN|nr:hypothetical protein [Lusitaniella coriacea]MBE9118218.1 hypothetical protein [Lusitaniella coriacea LEGE 07157]